MGTSESVLGDKRSFRRGMGVSEAITHSVVAKTIARDNRAVDNREG